MAALNPDAPRFTCFTPTYNRGRLLHLVWESLEAQTMRDFEWLVVDDGSTDDTAALVSNLAGRASFPVRYLRKENGGMHTAINLGALEARGEFFLKCDSDDRFLPESLERFAAYWEEIPAGLREGFVGVTVHCRDGAGRIVGDPFPADRLDSRPFELSSVHRVRGEKWGFQRTEILRRYPFPVFPGERRVPASLVWNRIGKSYLTRYVNDALRIYEIHEDSVTASSARVRAACWRGSSLYYDELSTLPIPPCDRYRAAVNYLRFAAPRLGLLEAIGKSAHPGLAALAALPGLLAAARDGRAARGRGQK